jgi:hypothetical protein
MRKLLAGVVGSAAVVGLAVAAWVRTDKRRASASAAEAAALARIPTPRRATAHDPTAMEVAERHQVNADRQHVIDTVLRSHGGRPARQIVPVLRSSLLAAGLSPEPESWLRAVATELANGHVYLVSQSNVETYETARQPSH